MERDRMFAAITQQRLRLCDGLDSLTQDEWDVSSLCVGWRTRDVVGHLLSILEVPIGTFLLNSVRYRGFDRYADHIAREFGGRDPQSLAASYRAQADARFAPPLVGPIAPLTDVLVHTRDIERPLGRPATLDGAAVRTTLDYVCGGKARGFVPPSRTKGLRFEATDLEWSVGEGAVVSGTGEAIMMAAMGRRSAVADLSGDGVPELDQRLC